MRCLQVKLKRSTKFESSGFRAEQRKIFLFESKDHVIPKQLDKP